MVTLYQSFRYMFYCSFTWFITLLFLHQHAMIIIIIIVIKRIVKGFFPLRSKERNAKISLINVKAFLLASVGTSGSYNLQRCVIGYNTGVLQSVIPSIYAILKILKCTSRSISTICHARKSSIFPKSQKTHYPEFFSHSYFQF